MKVIGATTDTWWCFGAASAGVFRRQLMYDRYWSCKCGRNGVDHRQVLPTQDVDRFYSPEHWIKDNPNPIDPVTGEDLKIV
jgi:hypothetical protein